MHSLHSGGRLLKNLGLATESKAIIPLPTRVIRGTPADLSELAPRQGPLRLAGCPQLLAVPSRGHRANISGGCPKSSEALTDPPTDGGGDDAKTRRSTILKPACGIKARPLQLVHAFR